MILTDFDDGLVEHSRGSLALVVPQPPHWLKRKQGGGAILYKASAEVAPNGRLALSFIRLDQNVFVE
jgi:hypothetical protein